jgi:hypothetical protein
VSKVLEREIPSIELRNVSVVKELGNWFTQKIISERPVKSLEVPENVHIFIEENEKKRQRELSIKKVEEKRQIRLEKIKQRKSIHTN